MFCNSSFPGNLSFIPAQFCDGVIENPSTVPKYTIAAMEILAAMLLIAAISAPRLSQVDDSTFCLRHRFGLLSKSAISSS